MAVRPQFLHGNQGTSGHPAVAAGHLSPNPRFQQFGDKQRRTPRGALGVRHDCPACFDDGRRGSDHCDGRESRVTSKVMSANMENTSVSKCTTSFGLALALASVINALLVVAKEKFPPVMAGLQKLTGHHWVSHSAIIIVVLAFFGWIFTRANGCRGSQITTKSLIRALVSRGVIRA